MKRTHLVGVAAVTLVVAAAVVWMSLGTNSHGGSGGTSGAVPIAPGQTPTARLEDGRVVAHLPYEYRTDGQPATVEQLARDLRVPGMVSIAGEEPKEGTALTEEQQRRLEDLVRLRPDTKADEQLLRNEFDQQRRAMRDRDPDRPKVGGRFGENREKMREAREDYSGRKRDLRRRGTLDPPPGADQPSPANAGAVGDGSSAGGSGNGGGRGDGSGGGRGDGSGRGR